VTYKIETLAGIFRRAVISTPTRVEKVFLYLPDLEVQTFTHDKGL
jgi:hypothetical protein